MNATDAGDRESLLDRDSMENGIKHMMNDSYNWDPDKFLATNWWYAYTDGTYGDMLHDYCIYRMSLSSPPTPLKIKDGPPILITRVPPLPMSKKEQDDLDSRVGGHWVFTHTKINNQNLILNFLHWVYTVCKIESDHRGDDTKDFEDWLVDWMAAWDEEDIQGLRKLQVKYLKHPCGHENYISALYAREVRGRFRGLEL